MASNLPSNAWHGLRIKAALLVPSSLGPHPLLLMCGFAGRTRHVRGLQNARTIDHREFRSQPNFGIYAVGAVRMQAEVGTGGLSRSGRHELTELFGGGERTVSVETAATVLGIGRAEAAKRLAGWASAGWLRRVRRGLYLAVPVDAPDPRAWTEDPWFLAALVWSPCFVTGWSAAKSLVVDGSGLSVDSDRHRDAGSPCRPRTHR